MIAKDIKKIIDEYYKGIQSWMVFHEVKTGPTIFMAKKIINGELEKSGRLDTVVFKPSWKNPIVFGYEIKTTYRDFKQDKKWKNYLKYVNKFAFICPENLIVKEEIPDDIGLCYIVDDKMKWIRRAKTINKLIPDYGIFQYMCMSRLERFHDC